MLWLALELALALTRKVQLIGFFLGLTSRFGAMKKNPHSLKSRMWHQYTGTQPLIAMIDARSIANAYYYGVWHARPGLLRMRRSTSGARKR